MKGYFDGQVRPKTGAPPLFPHDLEGDFALYVKHCSLLCVPRTRQLLKDDIMHSVQVTQFQNDKLGVDDPGDMMLIHV